MTTSPCLYMQMCSSFGRHVAEVNPLLCSRQWCEWGYIALRPITKAGQSFHQFVNTSKGDYRFVCSQCPTPMWAAYCWEYEHISKNSHKTCTTHLHGWSFHFSSQKSVCIYNTDNCRGRCVLNYPVGTSKHVLSLHRCMPLPVSYCLKYSPLCPCHRKDATKLLEAKKKKNKKSKSVKSVLLIL